MPSDRADFAPGPVTAARATPFPASVLLEWEAPADPKRPSPTKYFIVRLRLDPSQDEARIERTTFVHASSRTFADVNLAPGRYRYLVGALGWAGSGPASAVEVDIATS